MFEENAQEELRQARFEQGFEKGATNKQKEIAISMLAEGFEMAQIARINLIPRRPRPLCQAGCDKAQHFGGSERLLTMGIGFIK